MDKKTIALILILIGIVVLFGYWNSSKLSLFGGAPPGMVTEWATSSVIALSNSLSRDLFASSTCISRTITTSSTPIRIKFADSAAFVLSTNRGHLQDASTTVIYDGATYGCGLWTGFNTRDSDVGGDPAEGAVVTEFRGFR